MTQDPTSSIIVRFSAKCESAANKFIGVLRENIECASTWHSIEHSTQGSGQIIWQCELVIFMDDHQLNSCLILIEAIKDGLIPDTQNILFDIYDDVRVELADVDTPKSMKEINSYLFNKVQDQQKTIESMYMQISSISNILLTQTQHLASLKEQYEGVQWFLHSYVDLKNLCKVVREVAEQVDPNILEDFPLVPVH